MNGERLTLTWDVLKYVSESTEYLVNTWLTLTWDVLKFCHFCPGINKFSD